MKRFERLQDKKPLYSQSDFLSNSQVLLNESACLKRTAEL